MYRTHLDRYALGRIELSAFRATGYESGKSMDYWFNAGGLLVGLATGIGGC